MPRKVSLGNIKEKRTTAPATRDCKRRVNHISLHRIDKIEEKENRDNWFFIWVYVRTYTDRGTEKDDRGGSLEARLGENGKDKKGFIYAGKE